jgi:5-bromo-4-chloroindolyl phosphate hydrolysis protein
MQLSEGLRQVLAGSVAALSFLGLFFSFQLVWWISFLAAALVFLAVLLMVERKPGADEIVLSGLTTEADIREAGKIMAHAAERLEAAAARLGESNSRTIQSMLDHVRSIRSQVMTDPEDYRRARRFITSYLGQMVDTVERFAELSEKSRGRHEERLAPLSAMIESFVPALEKIDTACLEHDFIGLEAQVEALAAQMKRG